MTLAFHLKGLQHYAPTLERMLAFTNQRDHTTIDQCWLLEHFPIFTQGPSSKPYHNHHTSLIPCVKTDRGGKITYHGPGQLVAYCLLDIRRAGNTPHQLVTQLENSIISLLNSYNIDAHANPKARGVYIHDAKIAALGVRIRQGCCYHGIALNVNMDLSPFKHIDPCGFSSLAVTQLSEHVPVAKLNSLVTKIIEHLQYNLRYNTSIINNEIGDDYHNKRHRTYQIAWPRKASEDSC